MQQGRIKVVIADDHEQIRRGVRKLLAIAPEIRVVGEACNGQEAIELVQKHRPHVLILDLQMPVMDGIQVMDTLRDCKSNVRVLVLSAFNDSRYISEVLTRGAWGYYLKDEASTTIVEAVRQAARGDGKGTRPRPSAKLLNKLAGA